MLTCPVCSSVRVRAADVPATARFARCHDCRLLFAVEAAPDAPRAALSDVERRLEARVAARRRPHFDALLCRVGGAGRLVDVGAGVGAFVERAREAGWHAIGVDVDPAVVAEARARGRDVRLGELPALALPASSFDLVTLWNVLDFVREPVAILCEARRLLRPGGRLFVRTPNARVQLAGVRLTHALAARPRRVGVLHATNFTPRGLRVALERAGFTAVELRNSRPITGDPYLGLGRAGETALALAKRAIFAAVETAARASGGRWLLGPSIEALARRPA